MNDVEWSAAVQMGGVAHRRIGDARRDMLAAVAAGAALLAVSWLAPRSGTLPSAARGVVVLAPLGAGLYAWTRPPFERFGRLLVLASAGLLLATLSLSSEPWAYSIGRTADWIVQPLLLYVLLSFPSGRLTTRADRALVLAAAGLVAALFLPTAVLLRSYPTPAEWVTCGAHCPANAFMAVGDEAPFLHQILIPLRELLAIGLAVAVIARLAGRLQRTSRLGRLTLAPVLGVGIGCCAVLAGGLAARMVAPGSALVEVAVWMLALTTPAMVAGFVVGRLRWRLYVGASLGRLTARLRRGVEPDELGAVLADAFEDPTLRILPPGGEGAAGGRSVSEVRCAFRPAAVLAHDPALAHEPALSDAAGAFAAVAPDTAALTRRLQESREQLDGIADSERRRIARDLHDGAQQRLVALAIKLEAAAAQADPRKERDILRALGDEVEAALHDVRALGRGTPPRILTRSGLRGALALAGQDAPVPTTVVTGALGRYRAEIEVAVYFCCLEALQNASKHARGASAVHITVDEVARGLRLEVSDDGDGFDPDTTPFGTGLSNLRDRVAAVDGRVTVASVPGRGTRVSATIPV